MSGNHIFNRLLELDAEYGSNQLSNAIHSLGLPEAEPERPPLTFDEQLAAVSRGARLTTILPIRKSDPDYTLGGVCW